MHIATDRRQYRKYILRDAVICPARHFGRSIQECADIPLSSAAMQAEDCQGSAAKRRFGVPLCSHALNPGLCTAMRGSIPSIDDACTDWIQIARRYRHRSIATAKHSLAEGCRTRCSPCGDQTIVQEKWRMGAGNFRIAGVSEIHSGYACTGYPYTENLLYPRYATSTPSPSASRVRAMSSLRP